MRKLIILVVILILVKQLLACGDTAVQGNENNDNQTNQNNNNGNQAQPVCGNGMLETGEQCDQGSQNSDTAPNACRTTCRTPYCGDGVIDEAEQCDGSNLVGNTCPSFGFTKGALTCSTDTCQFDTSGCSLCGNNQAEGTDDAQVQYEVCDGTDLRGQDCLSIGQAQGTLACQALTCTWDIQGCLGGGAVCGNNIVEQGEECDDGGQDNCDGCSSTCRFEVCGNGQQDCGEECDDGNGIDTDACTTVCTVARCGDGFVQAGEECDDGNNYNCDSCSNLCQLDTCGNGLVECAEQCDRGGEAADCDRDCTVPLCGDGLVNVLAGEECDDANQVDGDGCSVGCLVESGWYCNGEPSSCVTECGDGVVVGTEQCDDGNVDNLDGCASDCSVESGWDCMGQPSYCDQAGWIGDPCTAGSRQYNGGGIGWEVATGCDNVPITWPGAMRTCLFGPSLWSFYTTYQFTGGYCSLAVQKCETTVPETIDYCLSLEADYAAMISCPSGSVLVTDYWIEWLGTAFIKVCAKSCTAAGQGQCRENPDEFGDTDYECIDKAGVKFCYRPDNLSPNYTAVQF
jgi:cysteine-rich repeat protein